MDPENCLSNCLISTNVALINFLVAVIEFYDKGNLVGKGLFWLEVGDYSPSWRHGRGA